jgi:hypothetical protein
LKIATAITACAMKPTVKATAAVEGDVYVRLSASPKRLRPRMRDQPGHDDCEGRFLSTSR